MQPKPGKNALHREQKLIFLYGKVNLISVVLLKTIKGFKKLNVIFSLSIGRTLILLVHCFHQRANAEPN